MIFWIEKGVEVSYDQLTEDLNKDDPIVELSGYKYFLTLLKELSKGQIITSIESLINYLIDNKHILDFHIETSGTTSVQVKFAVPLSLVGSVISGEVNGY